MLHIRVIKSMVKISGPSFSTTRCVWENEAPLVQSYKWRLIFLNTVYLGK